MKLTKRQAARFLLLKQGLLGKHLYSGKTGALRFVRTAGCIQFDPVDVCGKNAELLLLSRVKGFRREWLQQLLYEDRLLVDYPDKNMSIFPVENWPYFARSREVARRNGMRFPGLKQLEEETMEQVKRLGHVSSATLPLEGEIYWRSALHWSNSSSAARAALEQLYSTGDMVIHHKEGSRKFYDLSSRCLPGELLGAPDPLPDTAQHLAWRVLRRIGGVGMLWNRPSDAWLGIEGLDTAERNAAFALLEKAGRITQAEVEGIRGGLYILSEDAPLLDQVRADSPFTARTELLAPLDNMLWDRKLIRSLFGFDYSWEIYTPESKRKYGYYVLPVLHADRFFGRVEAVRTEGGSALLVKNLWMEEGAKKTKAVQKGLGAALERLKAMNGAEKILWQTDF